LSQVSLCQDYVKSSWAQVKLNMVRLALARLS